MSLIDRIARVIRNGDATCDHNMSHVQPDGMGAEYLVCEKCGYKEIDLSD